MISGAISGGSFDFVSMRTQLQELKTAGFERGDTDKSGGLSLDEFTAARADSPFASANVAGAPSAEEVFAKLDGDGDGEITSEEFSAAKPPVPNGGLSPETFSSVLSLQEQSGGSSILDLLSSAAGSDEASQSDLVGELLDLLNETGEDE